MTISLQGCVFGVLILAGVVNYFARNPHRQEHLEPSLAGQVAVVTDGGAGIGRGIAIALAEVGAKVYVLGRVKPGNVSLGSLEKTCALIRQAGGTCVPIAVDFTSDRAIMHTLDDVIHENYALDILVNAPVSYMPQGPFKPFWERGPEAWDELNQLLRPQYVACVYGAQLMANLKRGLIVNVGSFQGLNYVFDVPGGIGQAALDRMANDMAIELIAHKVLMVSLWPGLVQSESLPDMNLEQLRPPAGMLFGGLELNFSEFFDSPLAETPLLVGRSLAAFARDRTRWSFGGKVLLAALMAKGYGLTDERGLRSPPLCSAKYVLSGYFKSWLRMYGLWDVFVEPFGKEATVSDLMNFYWNVLPDLTLPTFLLKFEAGAPNL